jgi:hypothetical protein
LEDLDGATVMLDPEVRRFGRDRLRSFSAVDVGGDPDHGRAEAGALGDGSSAAEEPVHRSVGPHDAVLDVESRLGAGRRFELPREARPVFGKHCRQRSAEIAVERAGGETEERFVGVIPREQAQRGIPVPRADRCAFEREPHQFVGAAQLLFPETAVGDVVGDADHGHDLAVVVADRCVRHEREERRTVLALDREFARPRASRSQVVHDHDRVGHRIDRRRQLDDVTSDRLRRRPPVQRLGGRVPRGDLTRRRRHDDCLAHGSDQLAVGNRRGITATFNC